MVTLRDEAVILRRLPFQDTSLIIHFFTRHHGLVAAMARGIRQGKSSQRATTAGLHTVAVTLRLRDPQGLGSLAGADVVHGRHHLASDSIALAAAQVVQEAIYRGVAAHDANPALFEALEWILDNLEQGIAPTRALAVGLHKLLTTMGYGFNLMTCGRCGSPGENPFISLNRPQGMCGRCARMEGSFPLSPGLKQAFAGLAGDEIHLSPEETALLYRLAVTSLEHHGGKKLVADPPFRQWAGW